MSVARWLRVDLHAHTPFDAGRNWGRNQGRARDKGLDTGEEQARRWLDRCSEAGLDVVAITDHNQLGGYDQVAAVLEAWRQETGSVLCVLPGVELTVGGCHFLVVAEADQRDWLDRLVKGAFGTRDPLRKDGTPDEAKIGIVELARQIDDATAAGRSVLALPAHVDKDKGLTDRLKGLVRERAFAQRAWSGFQVRGDDFRRSKDLLRAWAAASLFGRLPDELDAGQRRVLDAFIARDAWPLVDASDPNGYDELGAVFTWMKMSDAGVEGIRQALLDPESRLRRHKDTPPEPPATWIESIEIDGVHLEGTSLFDRSVYVELSPALSTIIGGRGTGKSTIIELVRWALDRNRAEDFSPDEQRVKEQIDKRLAADGTGILGPEARVRVVVQRDGHQIEVVRTPSELTARPLDGTGEMDVRTAVEPRILSQRQIGEIAADARAIRREVDHAVSEDLARWRERRATRVRELERLQTQRRDLSARLRKRAAVQTDIQLLARKIEAIEQVAKSETLTAHRDVQRQARWLADVLDDLGEVAAQVPDEPLLDDSWPPETPDGPAHEILDELRQEVTRRRGRIEELRRDLTKAIVEAHRVVQEAQNGAFAKIRQPLVEQYQGLIKQLRDESVELGQLDALHAKHAASRKTLESLEQLPKQLEALDGDITKALEGLIKIYEERRSLRERVATSLEGKDADIRLDIAPLGDRQDLVDQRDRWWGGTGMRTEDWERLVAWVYDDADAEPHEVPARWGQLIAALRTDHEALGKQADRAEKVRKLASPSDLSGYLDNAVATIDPDRFDAMERYLPDDLVAAQFRDRDGTFRSIHRASLGQQNTAILSLLLTVGDGPLLLDQPEDDLDNRYIYDVVVELLRATKPARQIITVTHNPNIPVNGDAECIIALDPFADDAGVTAHDSAADRTSSMLIGSLERPEMKEAVSNIMEGSEAAFRLRRQRYGY